MDKLNYAFFGTPYLACQTLDILAKNGYTPSVIITSPDAKSGRGLELKESPVSLWANEHNIPCLKPEKIDNIFLDKLSTFNFELNIVVAYGKILPEKLIQTPQLGTINIHYSLLPKYRGASPLEACLLNGDTTTGVSIQQMVYKLDSGPILAYHEIPIKINDKKEDIRNKLINLGADLLCQILPKILNKTIIPKTQNESDVTYCTKIKKEDGEINIGGDARENYNKYRAFYGWPGTYFFTTKNNKKIRVKINEVIFEDNLFIIKKVTPEGKKEINYSDFIRQN